MKWWNGIGGTGLEVGEWYSRWGQAFAHSQLATA
jgi:hypothetical protein